MVLQSQISRVTSDFPGYLHYRVWFHSVSHTAESEFMMLLTLQRQITGTQYSSHCSAHPKSDYAASLTLYSVAHTAESDPMISITMQNSIPQCYLHCRVLSHSVVHTTQNLISWSWKVWFYIVAHTAASDFAVTWTLQSPVLRCHSHCILTPSHGTTLQCPFSILILAANSDRETTRFKSPTILFNLVLAYPVYLYQLILQIMPDLILVCHNLLFCYTLCHRHIYLKCIP